VLVLGAFSTRSLLQAAMLSTMVSSGEGSAYLVDSSGELLAGVGDSPPEQDLLVHPGVRAALRGEIGSHYLEAADGEHVVAFSQVQPTGWALIVEEPWASVASPALEISLAAPLVLIPALLITLVALWFGARQVIQPLRRLQQQAEDLADSKYDRVGEPVGGIAEIQQLQTTLTGMAQGIRAAHEALRKLHRLHYPGSGGAAQTGSQLHDAAIQDLIAWTTASSYTAADPGATLRPNGRRDCGQINRPSRAAPPTGALRPFLEDLGLRRRSRCWPTLWTGVM
jgi:HAMP domain-containing protein